MGGEGSEENEIWDFHLLPLCGLWLAAASFHQFAPPATDLSSFLSPLLSLASQGLLHHPLVHLHLWESPFFKLLTASTIKRFLALHTLDGYTFQWCNSDTAVTEDRFLEEHSGDHLPPPLPQLTAPFTKMTADKTHN